MHWYPMAWQPALSFSQLLRRAIWRSHPGATLALGAIGDAGAVGPLTALLGEKGEIRYCAIQALGLIGSMDASGQLMKCLNDPDPKTVKLAEEALKMLHT
jgi:HEAT repeat protein